MSLYIGNQKIPSINIGVATGGASPITLNLQSKTVTPSTNSQTVIADSGYDALEEVIVNAIPSSYIIPSGNKAITANGTNIDVKNFATVSVNVPTSSTINNQNKTVTPTESNQTINADSGYTGLGTVTVNAISSTYVGSGITRKAAATITPGTSNQTIAANTFLTGIQTIAGDSDLIASNIKSGISIFGVTGTYTGSGGTTINNQNKTVTPSTSQQIITADSGYTGLGTVTVNAMTTGTVTSPSTISGTTATVSTGTNTLTLTKTVSVTPNVTTAGYISSGTAGNASVSLTASVTTKAATTYNVSTSNQTIAAGTYLTGAQTIRAVTHTATAAKIAAGQTITIGDAGSATRIANLTGTFTSDATAVAADIASGETAYVNGSKLTGTLEFINIYTGTSAPSSSTGNNGDIYIQG